MNVNELRELNEQAEQLKVNLVEVRDMLTQIGKAWSELPSQDELSDYYKEVDSIRSAIESTNQAYESDSFPSLEHLQELSREALELNRAVQDANA